MAVMDIKKLKTITQVARDMGLTRARVSQLCTEAGIEGYIVGRARLLSPSDVRRIKAIPRRSYVKSQ